MLQHIEPFWTFWRFCALIGDWDLFFFNAMSLQKPDFHFENIVLFFLIFGSQGFADKFKSIDASSLLSANIIFAQMLCSQTKSWNLTKGAEMSPMC